MTPREELVAVPYARHAASADSLAATAVVSGSQIGGTIGFPVAMSP